MRYCDLLHRRVLYEKARQAERRHATESAASDINWRSYGPLLFNRLRARVHLAQKQADRVRQVAERERKKRIEAEIEAMKAQAVPKKAPRVPDRKYVEIRMLPELKKTRVKTGLYAMGNETSKRVAHYTGVRHEAKVDAKRIEVAKSPSGGHTLGKVGRDGKIQSDNRDTRMESRLQGEMKQDPRVVLGWSEIGGTSRLSTPDTLAWALKDFRERANSQVVQGKAPVLPYVSFTSGNVKVARTDEDAEAIAKRARERRLRLQGGVSTFDMPQPADTDATGRPAQGASRKSPNAPTQGGKSKKGQKANRGSRV